MHRLILLPAVLLLLPSCSAPRERYFLLTPAAPLASTTSALSLGVGPVTMPEYLDDDKLVTMGPGNEIHVANSHLWLGDLGKNTARVLATNLGNQLGTSKVQTYPWQRDSDIDYQITLRVLQFHGTNNGSAILEASWTIYQLPDSRVVATRTSRIEEKLSSDGFDALASAQSRCLNQLASQIATSLR